MRRSVNRIATLLSAAIFAGGYLSAQTIAITPGYMNIALGATQQYTATVTGLTPATVTWSVSGGGSIGSTGLFTAPATVPAGGAILIVATSTANKKIAAYDYVNPEGPGPTITAISPNPLPVGNDTIILTASASTPFIAGASITCGGALLSTKFISATAVSAVNFVAASPATVTCFVTNPGFSPSNSLTVPVKGAVSTPAPVVSPATASVGLGSTQQFAASNVTAWSALAGSITASGLYTAPAATTATGTDTVTATGPGGTSTASVTLLPKIIVSPATATITLGATQQFSASNVTAWSATSGAVSSTGLYTAPAIMPASGSDTVKATGPGGTGSAIVTLQNYPAPTLTSLSPPALPLGAFTATIAGTGFLPQSTVALGGTPVVVTSNSPTSLTLSGFAPTTGMVNVIVSNGSVASAPLPVQIGNPNAQVSAAAARRFLEQAGFGPTPADAALVQTLGFQGWLNRQFAMAPISNYNVQAAASQGGLTEQFMVNAVMNPDQLRQKVAFALSQIFVTSINTIIWNNSMIPYEQMLMADAFTNYRQLLGDVTLSPTMGQYLDMANNAMANPRTGTVANENYAREVMQLFSVGTIVLNPDGTPQFDSNGLLIPAYNQATIGETARVFTGWTYMPPPGQALLWGDYINPYGPMVPFPAEHDMGSKQLLNGYTEPAGLSPQQDVNNTLDNIFSHPNVGPFVGKLLIQHLVKSNPSPAYVGRVAAAFANNGNGVRGDMQAVITAILLDPEARANDNGGGDLSADGHLQEPILFVAGFMRAFGGTVSTQNYFGFDLRNMGQDLYNAPSVFNYYSPSFVPPGSSLLGPEFQIDTPDSSVYRANMAGNLFSSWSSPVLNYGPGTFIDVTPYMALSPNPATLVAALDLTLTHGTMPASMKQQLVAAVTSDTNGNLSRVLTGAWLILSSSYYNVWH
jgi:uncharacterized protein (DUF1800 family)